MDRRTRRAIAAFDSYVSSSQRGVRTNFQNRPRVGGGAIERRVSNGGMGG